MAVLGSDPIDYSQLSAEELAGLGSKLRKAVKKIGNAHKKVAQVVKGVVIPTKDNIGDAVETAKPLVGTALSTVGNVVAPGVGSILAAGWNAARAKIEAEKMVKQQNAEGVTEYFDSTGKPITKEEYDAIMKLAADAPAEVKPTLTINAGTVPLPTAQAEAGAPPANPYKWLLGGSVLLLAAGVTIKAFRGNGNNQAVNRG